MIPITPSVLSSLQQINTAFRPDELAYLALTQKVEHAIRDKLAFALHQSLQQRDQTLLVCREWIRRDLAVIQNDRPLLILEAKAIYSFDVVKPGAAHPFPELVAEDFDKAAQWVPSAPKDHPLETLSLVIATHPHTVPNDAYRQAVKYYGGVAKYAVGTNNFQSTSSIMNTKMSGFELLDSLEVAAGRAFGIDISVFLWLYRPRRAVAPGAEVATLRKGEYQPIA
jgi:hypothetical protein